jgi:hypothetical protein
LGTSPYLPIDQVRSLGMLNSLPQPRFMPCPSCGESVAVADSGGHRCDEERWANYQVFQLRDEVDALEAQFASYLESPRGRFEAWYAERRR